MPGKHLSNLCVLIVRCRVVQPSQMAFSIKVESLRARVSRYGRREHCSESPQAFATRNTGAKFLRFKVRIRENEWGLDVIPDQVAAIVRELQLVPSRRSELAAELLGRGLTLHEAPAVLPFQRYPIGPIERPQVGACKTRDFQGLGLCASLNHKLPQLCRRASRGAERPGNRHVKSESPRQPP